MNIILLIQLGVIGIVIGYQIYVLLTCRFLMSQYQQVFPHKESLFLKNVSIPSNQIRSLTSNDIENIRIGNFKFAPTDALTQISSPLGALFTPSSDKKQPFLIIVDLVTVRDGTTLSNSMKSVLSDINTYLVRNKNFAADFRIIRDMVTRHTDTYTHEIQSFVQTPIYIGLLGTLLGIILSIAQIRILVADQYTFLLYGIMLAFITSFTGMLFSLLLASKWRTIAKSHEHIANDFFGFLQTELLPILSHDMNASLATLQQNIHQFNEKFAQNLDGFQTVVGQVQATYQTQADFLQTLQKMNFNDIAEANIKVFRQMEQGAASFNAFLDYQNKLAETAQNLQLAVQNLQDITQKFNRIDQNADTIAQQVSSTLTRHEQIMQFIQNSLTDIQYRQDIVKNHIDVLDNSVQKSLEAYQDHMRQRLEKIKTLALEVENEIQKTFSANNIGIQHLQHLPTISQTLTTISEQLGQKNTP
jgi:biopolymer transport protein ExbB/TolQ